LHFVAGFCQRFEIPEFFSVEREVVLTTLQKNACQFVEVVLQSVVVAREQAGSECYFEHVTHKFHFVAYFQTAGTFENLYECVVSNYFQHFSHQLLIAKCNISNFVLSYRAIYFHGYQIRYNPFYFSFC
jgi:hypothetical protein